MKMTLDTVGLKESTTYKWFGACVSSHVNIEVGFLGEKLATAGQSALVFTFWILTLVLGSVRRGCR